RHPRRRWQRAPSGRRPYPSSSGQSAVVAQTTFAKKDGQFAYGAPLARTDDGGRTWAPLWVDLPDFHSGRLVTVTPTARIIAGSDLWGLACSADGGRSWARTCPDGG
ncbi:MAG TPA: hypothetical protein VGB03_09715, partial [Acidimicrobiales bacterium]